MSTPKDTIDTDEPPSPSTLVHTKDLIEDAETAHPSIPDAVDSRTYIEVQPSETPLDAQTVTRAMGQFFSILQRATKTGIRAVLTRSAQSPCIEWIVVSDGRDDTTVRYLVGTTHDDLFSQLESVLRTCFPDTYELSQVEWHPRHVDEYLPVKLTGTPSSNPDERTGPDHPAITPEHPYVAGVEYRGHADRRQDWQTPFTPFEEFTTQTRDRTTGSRPARSDESRRIPLASLLEIMQDVDVPIVYQAVCVPGGDWTDDADYNVFELERGLGSLAAQFWETFFPRDEEALRSYTPSETDQQRIDGVRDRMLRRTFRVSARAVGRWNSSRRF